jgi:hypothetical protein
MAADGRPDSIPMTIAAALARQILAGRRTDEDREHERLLDDAATALTQLSDLYYESDGIVHRVPSDEMVEGVFEGGGRTFRTRKGRELSGLSMQREEVMHALRLLERAIANGDS